MSSVHKWMAIAEEFVTSMTLKCNIGLLKSLQVP